LSEEAQAEILVQESLKTALVEGERLDHRQVRSSAARRLGLSTAGLPEPDRKADGLVAMLLDATRNWDSRLTATRLKGWQAALFPTGYSGLRQVATGRWRGAQPMQVVSGPLGRETVHFEAPPGDRVEREVRLFLDWFASGRGHLDGLVRAGVAHLRLVTIHPFEDGNGRIVRAATDLALAQDERSGVRLYSMSSQIVVEREDYYSALAQAQAGTCDVTSWLVWFLGCIARSMDRSDLLLRGVLARAAFWRAHAQIALSDRQIKVLRKLLEFAPGRFEGGLTTRKYVSMARVSRATAWREISDLVDKGILLQLPPRGRSASYYLNLPSY